MLAVPVISNTQHPSQHPSLPNTVATHSGEAEGGGGGAASRWPKVSLPLLALLYFVTGAIFFVSHGTKTNAAGEEVSWTLVDTLYFSIVTITTTGYGDLLPTTDGTKVFCCFYAYIGVGLIASVVGVLISQMMEAQHHGRLAKAADRMHDMAQSMERVRHQLTRRTTEVAIHLGRPVAHLTRKMSQNNLMRQAANSAMARSLESARRSAWSRATLALDIAVHRFFCCTNHRWIPWAHVRAVSMVLGMKLVGVLYFMHSSSSSSSSSSDGGGMSFRDALYFSCVTMSSVGYGDVSPASQGARMFSVFWIMVATMLVGRVVGMLVEDFMKAQQRKLNARTLMREFTMVDFNKIDANHDGTVDELEYFTYMVTRMGYVARRELNELRHRFAELDLDGSGSITVEDLKKLARTYAAFFVLLLLLLICLARAARWRRRLLCGI